jgi:hypothetical protein
VATPALVVPALVVVPGIEWAKYPVAAATVAISAAAVQPEARRDARMPLSRTYVRRW